MITRRRFLAGFAALAGATATGAVAWLTRSTSPSAAPPNSNLAGGEATTTVGPSLAQPNSNLAGGEATTSTPPPESTTSTTEMPPDALEVICRDAWGALPVVGEFRRHEINQITVHHTAVVLDDNALAPSRIRGHQEFHQGRGWPDIAYHFIVDASGNIYEGRPVDAVGDTGTDYDPTGHFLVCCEGDFDQQDITDAQYESLVKMLAWGAAEFSVDPAKIHGHRDVAATSCPGDGLYALLADGSIAADVDAAVVGRLRVICGDAGAALVSAIEAG